MYADEQFEIDSRIDWYQHRQHLASFFRPLWLTGLCLISLSGWITAFWGVLSGKNENAGLDFSLRRPGMPQVIDNNPGNEMSHHGAEPENSELVKGLSVDEILDDTWKPAAHSFRWAGNGEEPLLIGHSKSSAGESEFSAQRLVSTSDGGLGNLRLENFLSSQNGPIQSSYTHEGREVTAEDVWVDDDGRYALILSNKIPEWRRSFRALYWLLELNSTSPSLDALDRDQPLAEAQLAILSPTGHNVAFVRDGNIYLRHTYNGTVLPITTDTDHSVHNGIPGWGYEEEILESNAALWWSPGGMHLAFLRTDESMVQIYTMDLYTSTEQNRLYPQTHPVRYPRPGTLNPVVSIQIYDVERGRLLNIDLPDQLPDNERIIFSVVWLTDHLLLLKHTNRESSVLMVFLIDLKRTKNDTVEAELIRTESGSEDCWAEPIRKVVKYVPANSARDIPSDGYIDMVVHDGYNHLAYFTPLRSSMPSKVLTSGQWEVIDAPTVVDGSQESVFFLATVPRHPDQRHLYRASLDGRSVKAVTDDTQPAYYDVSFDRGGQYAVLKYMGPDVPRTFIIALTHDAPEVLIDMESSTALSVKAHEAASKLPRRQFHYIDLGAGSLAPIMELLPPNFDPGRQYPVIFSPYGGPGSQSVTQRFAVDFATLLASRGYVVVVVDGRGTGFNGRDTRCAVHGRLGYFEAADQIAAGRLWKSKEYVDSDRLVIWGWSFGGYLTLKTLDMDGGRTFGMGMAVAPVTDWRLYGERPNQEW